MTICNTCKIDKSVNEFYNCRRNNNGLTGDCKKCSNMKTVLRRNKIRNDIPFDKRVKIYLSSRKKSEYKKRINKDERDGNKKQNLIKNIEIIKDGEDCYVSLLKKSKTYGDQYILLDFYDFIKFKDCSFSLFQNGYCLYVRTSKINGKRHLLHRLLTGCPEDMVVDHINCNSLDNRRKNLRVCSARENSRNKISRSSIAKGVFTNSKNSYAAAIGVDNKVIYLGSFNSKNEAIEAYNNAAIKYFGEFANLNPIKD